MRESYIPAQGIKFSETKGACQLAYNANEGESYTFPDGKIWKVIKVKTYLFGMGFRAIILIPENGGYKTILAFAGTDITSIADLWTDAYQLMNPYFLLPDQYWLAVKFVLEAKGKYGGLVLTGHSLGGGLAAYTSLRTNTPATTINPAPLSVDNATFGLLSNLGKGVKITNYICGSPGRFKGEVVTSLSSGVILGEKFYVAGVDGAGFLTRHKIENTGAGIGLPKIK